jgi:hypothetical protein
VGKLLGQDWRKVAIDVAARIIQWGGEIHAASRISCSFLWVF